MLEKKSSTKLDEEVKTVEINLQGKTLQELRSKSLQNIEEFWAQEADNLIWSKNGIKYLIGIRLLQNGLLVVC